MRIRVYKRTHTALDIVWQITITLCIGHTQTNNHLIQTSESNARSGVSDHTEST